MKEGPKVPAFKEKLLSHSEHGEKTRAGSLLQFQGRNDLVVRPLNWAKMLEKGRVNPGDVADVSAVDFAKISKRHFDELRMYGVEVPVSFVVADSSVRKQKYQEEVFAVVENVKQAEHPDRARVGKAFAILRENLLRYYTDKVLTDESFLADIVKDRQYVYGRRPGDKKDKLYLVDIEPYIYNGPVALRVILRTMTDLLRDEKRYFKSSRYDVIISGFELLLEMLDSRGRAARKRP